MTISTLQRAEERAATGRPADTPQRIQGHAIGFWLVASAYLATMAFATVPTPLYPLYQRELGFSTLTITVIFAVYAIGVLASLFLAGHLSDWIGRRTALLTALAIQLIAAVLFLFDPALPLLIVARLISGVGVGMLTATATAYLQELHRASRPHAGPKRFEVVSTAANLGGLGIGPLFSGVLAEHAAWPLFTPYLSLGLVLMLAAAAVAFVPETVATRSLRGSYRPQRISVNRESITGYAAAVGAGFVAFAVFGVFSSVAPGFLAGELRLTSPTLAGIVTVVVFGGAAAAQTLLAGLTPRRQRNLGVLAQAAGLVGFVAGMHVASFGVFLLGGLLAGAGSGILFKSAVGSVAAMARPGRRSEALAGLFLFSYLGLAVPSVGLGLATLALSATVAMSWLAALLLAALTAIAVLGRSGATPVRSSAGSADPRSPVQAATRPFGEPGLRRQTVLALTGIRPEAVLFSVSSDQSQTRRS
ncbi:MFS transporter [Lysobacter korlensis]|uniref:MFS transporter n=1 Tax=Lysobacter korlensis TaxID=553636 RepID=A0ABV6S3B3_9GAMM